MKRLLGGLLFAAVLLYNGGALADTSRSSIVIEKNTGRVLYAHNAHEALPMASTTKVMTALIALENASLDETVTAGRNAFGVPGTSIYLAEGESLTMEQMLYGLMLASGNDAAVAIAEHVGGTVENFCRMMTERAEELGCENTVFVTPHGLPNAAHHTTAWDMALIARKAMDLKAFRTIVSTRKAYLPWAAHDYSRVVTNKNRLLSSYDGATGIKTGYTAKAGRCLVFSAARDGMELIGVVLNCPDWFNEAARLLDNVFEQYALVTVLRAGQSAASVQVTGGETTKVDAYAERALSVPMLRGLWPEVRLELPETVAAGVRRGDVIGQAVALDNGEEIDRVALRAAQDVPEASFRFFLRTVLEGWPGLPGT